MATGKCIELRKIESQAMQNLIEKYHDIIKLKDGKTRILPKARFKKNEKT